MVVIHILKSAGLVLDDVEQLNKSTLNESISVFPILFSLYGREFLIVHHKLINFHLNLSLVHFIFLKHASAHHPNNPIKNNDSFFYCFIHFFNNIFYNFAILFIVSLISFFKNIETCFEIS